MSAYQNRIVGYGEEDPKAILAHPSNWRKHPEAQREALRAALTEIGYVGTVKINQRTGRMVDGHLRVEDAAEAGQPTIPVTYLDLSEEEEALALATFDPLGSQAQTDSRRLSALIDQIAEVGPDMRALLNALSPGPVAPPAAPEASSGYTDGLVRQLYIVLPAGEYERAMWQIEHLMDAHPELDTTVAVVKWLLTRELEREPSATTDE